MTRARLWLVLGLLAVAGIVARCSCRRAGTRVATFNIENYPQSQRQVAGAFAILGELDVAAVAVQEITDPDHFEAQARARLGSDWQFVHTGAAGLQRVGVLFDGERFELLAVHVHTDTVVYANGKPALEARLRPRDGGTAIRLFALHLKAGGEHPATRARQLRALAPVIARAVASRDAVIVAGDYNATGPADRHEIERFARATGLVWASEDLECTSYWARRDECRGTPLDHVVMSQPAQHIAARGPCEDVGCRPGDRCPVFHAEVSDHCPVTVDLSAASLR